MHLNLQYFKHRYPLLVILLFIQSINSLFAQSDSSNHRYTITKFFEKQAKVQYIYQTTLSPDGNFIAWSADDTQGGSQIIRASLRTPADTIRISATQKNKHANETEPQWSPDGHEIAFLSDAQSPGQVQVFIANAYSGVLMTEKPLTHFDGYVSHLKWSPDGKYISVLYVEKASREPSPMAAENKPAGLIDSLLNRNIQRIAVVNRATRETQQVTPLQLYIFEYDWSPKADKFVYTAAPPPGDDNWYIATLYQQSVFGKDTVSIYKPNRQIAVPRWSPDGRRVAFIEGLMSDQGGTGGEIFIVDAGSSSKPFNLTPDRRSTPSWFTWIPDGNIIFTEFVEGSVAINQLTVTNGKIQPLYFADESMRAGNEEMSLSVAIKKNSPVFAFIRNGWNMLPEIWVGNLKNLTQITKLNSEIEVSKLKPENITWTSDAQKVQGWLLPPLNYDSAKRYPMLVCVHGGPAWITTPTWSAPDFNSTVYTQLGYFIFFPNPRGSYGQGELFTLANRRDWGFGDLRDIISGVDAVISKHPIDRNRVGIFGWSYGGATSMFAVTQTNRFRAAVAGAGAADWQSYYGQNSIDKWMLSYFGASPYDDPAAYARSSAMTYIKNAKTPILILVGERDGEAPPPQSFQFWHALKELKVPTQLMVYPDEGHSFEKFENMIDVSVRTIEWFNTFMKAE
jgi:dipeptidyl aminopeptidase/acylaminoacyl peptidase